MNENKDHITIFKEDGTTEQMEVIATFKLEETQKTCIIYKDTTTNEGKYYAASYDAESNLNTNFSDKEKEQLNKIFEELIIGGKNNA